MIEISHVVVPKDEVLEFTIEGMRNPLNSWDKSDSAYAMVDGVRGYVIGDNDHNLMFRLSQAGKDHRKYLRMLNVYVRITAPLYWWKEFDTYKVGTVANSCSTMHKIQDKEFTLEDFSCEHLMDDRNECWNEDIMSGPESCQTPLDILRTIIDTLNVCRNKFCETKDKKYWWQMIQLLPSSYNQRRTIDLNFEVLLKQYRERKNHKLDEWHTYCDWIKEIALLNEIIKKYGY